MRSRDATRIRLVVSKEFKRVFFFFVPKLNDTVHYLADCVPECRTGSRVQDTVFRIEWEAHGDLDTVHKFTTVLRFGYPGYPSIWTRIVPQRRKPLFQLLPCFSVDYGFSEIFSFNALFHAGFLGGNLGGHDSKGWEGRRVVGATLFYFSNGQQTCQCVLDVTHKTRSGLERRGAQCETPLRRDKQRVYPYPCTPTACMLYSRVEAVTMPPQAGQDAEDERKTTKRRES